jgi:hypothetical protein
MKYKQKVLKRFPDAVPVTVNKYEDGSPRHISISANGSIIDIYDNSDTQSYKAAWRSAYYWGVRNPC